MRDLHSQILRQVLLEISDAAKKKVKDKFKKENPALTDAQMDYYIRVFEKRVANSVFKKKDLFQYTFSELEQTGIQVKSFSFKIGFDKIVNAIALFKSKLYRL